MAGFDLWIGCKNTAKYVVSWIRLDIFVNLSADSRVKFLQLIGRLQDYNLNIHVQLTYVISVLLSYAVRDSYISVMSSYAVPYSYISI